MLLSTVEHFIYSWRKLFWLLIDGSSSTHAWNWIKLKHRIIEEFIIILIFWWNYIEIVSHCRRRHCSLQEVCHGVQGEFYDMNIIINGRLIHYSRSSGEHIYKNINIYVDEVNQYQCCYITINIFNLHNYVIVSNILIVFLWLFYFINFKSNITPKMHLVIYFFYFLYEIYTCCQITPF